MGRRKVFLSKPRKKNKRSLLSRKRSELGALATETSVVCQHVTGENKQSLNLSYGDMVHEEPILEQQSILRDVTNTAETTSIIQPDCNVAEFAFIDENEYEEISGHKLTIECVKPEKCNQLPGHRIVDLEFVLEWSMGLQVDHAKKCSVGKLQIIREERSGLGLASLIIFQCNFCNEKISKSTERPVNDNNCPHLSLNMGAVWGTLSTGGTYSHMSEFLACLDIPRMSFRTFHSIELFLANKWNDELWQTIEKAGEEELKLAKEKGQIDKDGVAWTIVYADGGWSQRSYGHNYNAASGVGVIIGQLTSKILYIGVRNKYCIVCSRAMNKQENPMQHICFKNWDKSSAAMETDIIIEGFNQSVKMHKLKYKKLIADADASVYSNIMLKVQYGMEVEKIECVNHAIKNYGKALYKLQKDTKLESNGRKLLTVSKIKELQNISKRILYENMYEKVEVLKSEFEKGPNHVFGDHSKCLESYCKSVGNVTKSLIPTLESTGIYYHIKSALDRLVRMAGGLKANETNNKAEMFMSLVCKFNAGKRLNLTQRGSFETRAYLAALRYNLGVAWKENIWETVTESTPGENFKKYMETVKRNYATHCRIRETVSRPKRKRIVQDNNKEDYGKNVPTPTLPDSEYTYEALRILERMQVTKEEILKIELSTKGQWENPHYRSERRDRLTASLFGEVLKKRETTHCHNLVKKILYETNFSSEAMMYGRANESVALQKFQKQRSSARISPSGLFIDEKYGFLAASPDALLGDNALIEVKCLHSVHKSKKTLLEAVKERKICLELRNNQLSLKRAHNYYYQVQGQLNIAQKDMCYFIVYINDEQPLHVEVILKDKKFWNENVQKLKEFYEQCVLPEIIYKNIPKGLKAKEPNKKTNM